MERFEFKWEAPEYEHRPKDISWYWISILVALLMLGLAVWQRNFLFGIFILMAEALLIIWGSREPRTVTFLFDNHGFHIGERKYYPYHHIKGYSIAEHPHSEWADLIVHLHERLRRHVLIHIKKSERGRLEALIRPHLKILPHDETFVDVLERFFGF